MSQYPWEVVGEVVSDEEWVDTPGFDE